jgi:hypothetical protein
MDDVPSEAIQRCVWWLKQISVKPHLVEGIGKDDVG